ncbi:DUF4260 domain-containing protein [Paracoccus pacificus]|uniref:DUF4260 domain-containing protein n=1 Tax=Paracoccus pacificus TaxID=1463598 RepID=A0ABW4RD70_9RHOB
MTARVWQQAEGAGVAVAGLGIAALTSPGWGWWLWILILLAPDLTMLGYLAGPRVGAVTYNLGHIYALPLLLAVAGVAIGATVLLAIGGVWLAHVGIDRMLGYGLKLPSGFQDTHMGRIGRDR